MLGGTLSHGCGRFGEYFLHIAGFLLTRRVATLKSEGSFFAFPELLFLHASILRENFTARILLSPTYHVVTGTTYEEQKNTYTKLKYSRNSIMHAKTIENGEIVNNFLQDVNEISWLSA